ncbi:MAG: Rieske 2Fe-2S domain-containing protein [Ilumatobacteraceae bacterium]
MNDRRGALFGFGLSAVGSVGFVIAYWTDAGSRWLGAALSAALLGFGVGLISWSKAIDDGDAVEQRHSLAADDAEVDALSASLSRTSELTDRRSLLAAVGAAVVALGAMIVVPLRSLGPRPKGIGATPWRAGRRLVTSDGRPVDPGRVGADGLLTVYPEGAQQDGNGAVIVVRLPVEQLSRRTIDGGAVDGIVAYSKICTHAGCAVGLFQADSRRPDVIHRLLCPCHQSEFDPADGARPVAGPATRSLAQLPLTVDADGNLVATDGFDRPVGPASWTWP